MAVQSAREPLVAIDVDLDREREPGLHLHVDEAEVAVHEVVAKLEALAPGWPDECFVLLPHQRERAAGFQNGKDADESFADTVTLGDLASQILGTRPGSSNTAAYTPCVTARNPSRHLGMPRRRVDRAPRA